MKELNRLTIGERIRSLRVSMGYSREDLADLVNISTTFCREIEIGAKGMGVDTLYRIACALKVSTDYILTGKENNRDITAVDSMMKSCTDEQFSFLERIIRLFLLAMGQKE